MTRNLFVVLGDVVDSQAIEDRQSFRQTLTDTLDAVNTRHDAHVHTEFELLKGIDEIGGVLDSLRPIYDVRRTFTERLHPHQIRLAVTYGEIDVGLDSGTVTGMDGPAFARADRVLADVEDADGTFGMAVADDSLDTLIADEVNLLDMLKQGWSDRQLEVVRAYRDADSQREVAEELDVSPQAISKTLKRSDAAKVFAFERRLDGVVADYDRRLADGSFGSDGR